MEITKFNTTQRSSSLKYFPYDHINSLTWSWSVLSLYPFFNFAFLVHCQWFRRCLFVYLLWPRKSLHVLYQYILYKHGHISLRLTPSAGLLTTSTEIQTANSLTLDDSSLPIFLLNRIAYNSPCKTTIGMWLNCLWVWFLL